ncbi:Hypothetical protein PENO1_054890 [Penicillium occitanis (nom. inval.)]|nr:hypothetical protein PENOC_085830 [Penicillium occitanis (nom. inval.)]PCG99069.1 Hypothetical protein PENO1_054890 [Penicillium occitanis (nom. inval.)]
MASMLDYFKMRFSLGKGRKDQIFPCNTLCFLGLQPATAEKVFLVNNSPILSMLLHEKIFKIDSQAVESAEPTVEAQGRRIDGLPEMEQPAEPTSEAEEKKYCELLEADEPVLGAVEPTFGAEEQEDETREEQWSDDMSGSSSCYTRTWIVLDRVLHAGDQPTFSNFANVNCESESENPIPPEYEADIEYLQAALKQFPLPPFKTQSKADTRHQPHEDPLGYESPPLTQENLKKSAQAITPCLPVPSCPYPFMKNPRHHDPCYMAHDQNENPLECWDGCPDCEVYAAVMGPRLWKVHHWFENHFTHHDLYQGDFGKNPSHPSLKYPEPDPDDEYEWHTLLVKREHDEDYLLGAEGDKDFPYYKLLYRGEPEDTRQDITTLLVQYMQVGEAIDVNWALNFNNYYGDRFNAILQEYEPHPLPNIGFGAENKLHVLRYPGIKDMSKPIWEARGYPWPMQTDYHTRMEYAKMEYNRKLLMFRAQDEARQRYIQQVREAARYEYVQKGLLEDKSSL